MTEIIKKSDESVRKVWKYVMENVSLNIDVRLCIFVRSSIKRILPEGWQTHCHFFGFSFFMTYQEQLLTPEWQEKRQQVINHYWGYCSKCMSSKNIQVHHKYYVDGRMAWEYPIEHCLITLCRDCHTLEHGLVPERRRTKTINELMIEWLEGLLKKRDNA